MNIPVANVRLARVRHEQTKNSIPAGVPSSRTTLSGRAIRTVFTSWRPWLGPAPRIVSEIFVRREGRNPSNEAAPARQAGLPSCGCPFGRRPRIELTW